ncbi:MAG TPA: hypothetical protein VE990_18990 [Acidimicrobiales bacterium]|nr:hypothetical protein [Acidimicrobiales bacterium]
MSIEDHAVGLELQLIEMVEQRERARVQGRSQDVESTQAQIAALQKELADLAEEVSTSTPAEVHHATRAGGRASAA